MPLRTKSHIVGDRGVVQVQQALPAAWVTRIVTPDYGIDLELEVPDDTGRLNGLIAKAQIKGLTGPVAGRRCIRVSTEHLIYWQALPTRVYVFGAFVDTGQTFVLDVHKYLWARGLRDSLLQSGKRTHSIPLKSFLSFPQASTYIRDGLIEYAERLHDTRSGGPYKSLGARYIAALLGAWAHKGDIDSQIDWCRYFGGEEQLREDLPYLLWLKRDLAKRSLDYKSFLSFVLNIDEIELASNAIWDKAINRVKLAAASARRGTKREGEDRGLLLCVPTHHLRDINF